MTRTAEFFFDVGSPASYLAYTQIGKLCESNGATLVLKPMLLGGVFGAPTTFVGDEMHFGQDRLDFVAEALRNKS
jgi:2-hydroxychromene-2-carboxylate isomerase